MFLAEFQNINNSGQVNTSQLNCFTFGFDNTQQGNISGEHNQVKGLRIKCTVCLIAGHGGLDLGS